MSKQIEIKPLQKRVIDATAQQARLSAERELRRLQRKPDATPKDIDRQRKAVAQARDAVSAPSYGPAVLDGELHGELKDLLRMLLTPKDGLRTVCGAGTRISEIKRIMRPGGYGVRLQAGDPVFEGAVTDPDDIVPDIAQGKTHVFLDGVNITRDAKNLSETLMTRALGSNWRRKLA